MKRPCLQAPKARQAFSEAMDSLGRGGGRCGRGRARPHRGHRARSSSCSTATGPGTSAPSATRRSSLPTASGSCSQIGWRHAEPVLRSLAYALLHARRRQSCPARRPGRPSLAAQPEAGRQIPGDWQAGKSKPRGDRGAAGRPCGRDRTTRPARRSSNCCDAGRPRSRSGTRSSAAPAELLLRQPGIVALHAVTTTNALHYAYSHQRRRPDPPVAAPAERGLPAHVPPGDGRTRPICARLAIDRLGSRSRSPATARRPSRRSSPRSSRDRQAAAGKTLAYLQAKGSAEDFIDDGRRLVLLKGNDPARLQVQRGGAGRLLPCLARVARPLPCGKHGSATRLREARTTSWLSVRRWLCKADPLCCGAFSSFSPAVKCQSQPVGVGRELRWRFDSPGVFSDGR